VDYLDAVRDRIIPELTDRPLSVIRVLRGQAPFMQKNVPKYTPPWVRTVQLWAEASKREVSYALCDDRRTLLWFANQRAVEYHPTLSRAAQPHRPTQLVLDIDPPSGEDFGLAVRAAFLVRQALADAGLAGAVKTSGAKGVHVFVPIETDAGGGAGDADEAGDEALGWAAARRPPRRRGRSPPARSGWTRRWPPRRSSARTATARCSWTRPGPAGHGGRRLQPRIRPGVPVSFPVAWADLDRVAPADFTVHTAAGLLGDGDSWASQLPAPQRLSSELIEEGRAIPVARVQAMHEGKRRARARREAGG